MDVSCKNRIQNVYREKEQQRPRRSVLYRLKIIIKALRGWDIFHSESSFVELNLPCPDEDLVYFCFKHVSCFSNEKQLSIFLAKIRKSLGEVRGESLLEWAYFKLLTVLLEKTHTQKKIALSSGQLNQI